jgi:disulfide bond formation protein DsbB
MLGSVSSSISNDPGYRWGALSLFAALAAILIALGFQHLGGMQPCPLCLQQRYAYYAGIPALFVALVLLRSGRPRAAAVLFFLVSLAFLANAGLGAYHAGAEWKFWPGPDSCAATGAAPQAGGNLLERLKNVTVIRCDEAAGRFLGLSFAGWNVFLSVAMVIGTLQAAFSTKEKSSY